MVVPRGIVERLCPLVDHLGPNGRASCASCIVVLGQAPGDIGMGVEGGLVQRYAAGDVCEVLAAYRVGAGVRDVVRLRCERLLRDHGSGDMCASIHRPIHLAHLGLSGVRVEAQLHHAFADGPVDRVWGSEDCICDGLQAWISQPLVEHGRIDLAALRRGLLGHAPH